MLQFFLGSQDRFGWCTDNLRGCLFFAFFFFIEFLHICKIEVQSYDTTRLQIANVEEK